MPAYIIMYSIIPTSQIGSKQSGHFFSCTAAQGIIHPLSFLPALNQPCLSQNAHMMGKCRLRYSQLFQQYTGTFFLIIKLCQNL